METARIDLNGMQRDLLDAVDAMHTLSRSLSVLGTRVADSYASSSIGEQWARTWGETLNKKEAASMLGVGLTYLRSLIDDGSIVCAPDGRVLTRSAAEWANSSAPKRKSSRFRVE